MKVETSGDGSEGTVETWVLRKACEDLLPQDLVWRKKAQFDEGSGTVDVLQDALRKVSGARAPLSREEEGQLYERLLRRQYEDPDLVLECAGEWASDRVDLAE